MIKFKTLILLLVSIQAQAKELSAESTRMPDPKVIAEVALPFRTSQEFSKHLKALRDHFLVTDDPRAVFADAYVVTEKNLQHAIDAHRFRNTDWMLKLTLVFANLYREALLNDELGSLPHAPIPHSWQVAFTETRGSHKGVLKHLVLGMNAHIDRDLPYALETASRGTPMLKRVFSRYLDYNRVGRILVHEIWEIEDLLIEHFPEESHGLKHLRNRIAEVFLGIGLLGMRERAWQLGMALRYSTGTRVRGLVSRSIEFRANFYANRLRNLPHLQIDSQVPEFLP